MIEEIERVQADAVGRVATATSLDELAALDTELLGKRSALTGFKKQLGGLDADERRVVGQALNRAREEIEAAFGTVRSTLAQAERAVVVAAERLDLTEVLEPDRRGHLHLVTQSRDRLEDVFVGMGFLVEEG